ncbi:MAG: mandelate racemase [Armatimonadetes bacterium]|nr:mandelate racemase [Armatimonadota bacterium]
MKIERVEALAVRLPFRGTFATSQGTVGSAAEGAEHVVVRLQTDDGTVGWGECRPSRHWSYETHESVCSSINRYFDPALRGHNPFDLAGIDRLMSRAIAPGFTLGQPIARAGVELAVWDLLGKRLGVPVQTLLGGTSQRAITLSWTVVGHEPEAVAGSVEEGRRRGYRNFNFKVGFGATTDRLVARTIAELAPDAFLWADANQAYGLDEAVRASRMLAEFGVAVLEQPLPVNRYTDYPLLRSRSALPIGVDEGLYTPADLLQLVRLQALDVFVIKLCRMGGIRRSRQAIELAQAAGLTCLGSGLTESEIALAACAHLLAAAVIETPNALNGRQFLGAHLASGLAGEGDQVVVPSAPGLGIKVDEQRLAALRVPLSCEP